jgi:hypothetical protein
METAVSSETLIEASDSSMLIHIQQTPRHNNQCSALKKEAPKRFQVPVSHPTITQRRRKTGDSSEMLVYTKLLDLTINLLS